MMNENRFRALWSMSRYVYGIVPILIGADKFTFFIVNWNIYVSSYAASIIPITMIVPLVGIIEIIAGLLILTKYPRFGAYLVAAWIGIVIINLFLIGNLYDIILRDIAIAYGYIVFAKLTELNESSNPYPL